MDNNMDNNKYKEKDIQNYKGEEKNVSCYLLNNFDNLCSKNSKNLQDVRMCNIVYKILKDKCVN